MRANPFALSNPSAQMTRTPLWSRRFRILSLSPRSQDSRDRSSTNSILIRPASASASKRCNAGRCVCVPLIALSL